MADYKMYIVMMLLLACGDGIKPHEFDGGNMCGNGVIDLDEECDDANVDDADACLSTCVSASCGDGFLQTGAEQCDDANANNNDDCLDTCVLAGCGDGFVYNEGAGTEACDDGNASNGDDCLDDCTAAVCGDGFLNSEGVNVEACDDGLLNSDVAPDACRTTCQEPSCGDGVRDTGEPCDNGAANSDTAADACRTTCENPRCGDMVIDGAEDCEGTDVGGATCESGGYLPGSLSCDAAACAFDTSLCGHTESAQNDNGVCNEEIGCANGDGTSGNPNEIVECFNSQLGAPFELTEVSYEIGANPGAPSELFAEVYDWDGVGLPGIIVDSVQLGPADLSVGAHTVPLATPLNVFSSTFCIGINGYVDTDGYRMMKSQTTSLPNASFIKAPTCGANDYTSMAAIGFPGNWCISGALNKP